MGETTEIAWAGKTWNPWVGCTKISPGCKHCYAETWSKRAGRQRMSIVRLSVESWRSTKTGRFGESPPYSSSVEVVGEHIHADNS